MQPISAIVVRCLGMGVPVLLICLAVVGLFVWPFTSNRVMGIYGLVRHEQSTRKIDSNYRSLDMNGCEAIRYIAVNSLAGTTFPENSKCQLARTAFYEAARTEKIQVAGMPEGSTLLENIHKRIWDGENSLDIRECMRSLRINWKDEEKILYWGLMVNRREIQKTWPEAPPRRERA
jgi:hypothetical protein